MEYISQIHIMGKWIQYGWKQYNSTSCFYNKHVFNHIYKEFFFFWILEVWEVVLKDMWLEMWCSRAYYNGWF